MSTPVTTDKWAGTFECLGPCRRKRLTGSEFSKKALEKHRKSIGSNGKGHTLRCKKCVEEAESAERKAAAERRTTQENECSGDASNDNAESDQVHNCAACKADLSASSFNRNQLSKGPGKARCRSCVEKSIADEAKTSEKKQLDALTTAKDALKKAEAKGDPVEMLKASNHLSTLEAQHVTGLKPVKLGRGRGRGRGRGSGRTR